jgi:5-methylcytosine-specific restriction endonuclease McrA
MPKVMQRYSGGKTLRTTSTILAMPTDHKAKKRLVKTWQNPYTGTEKLEREALFSYDEIWAGQETRDGWTDLREEVMKLKGTTCFTCGKVLHPSEVEIDEIKPRASFKEPKEAERMGNLRPLCTPCHRAKTKIDRKVLSRMR